jgi:nitrogen PTS system EIIA component
MMGPMADEDFTIETLAAYLHLAPAIVAKLADRGKIPGRKVAGQWRFSPAEVHHWLEDRIGLSDDEELAEMEGFLRRPAAVDHEHPLSIAEMLPLAAIAVPLEAKTRGSVISQMVERGGRTGWLWEPKKMEDAVRAREEMSPTALDNGVALLHPRRPMPNILGQAFLAFGRTERGVPFGGRVLTDLFFLICSVDDRGHLQTLARISRLVNNPDLLSALRQAPDARAVHDMIAAAEVSLDAT